jgi:hypothetical protein
MDYGDRMAEGRVMRMGTLLVGALLAAATLPQVWMAIEATRELAGRPSGGVHMLDYETQAWVRSAFVLSHLWLGWQARALALGESTRFKAGLVVLLALEVAVIWMVVVWLALRGWGRVLF